MPRLSTSALAELVGQDRRTVASRLRKAGLTAVAGERRAKLYESSQALRVLVTGGDEGEGLDPQQERARLDRERRLAQELENAKRREELVPMDVVVEMVGKDYDAIRSKLLTLPVKLAARLGKTRNIRQRQKVLHDAICEVLAELSEGYSTDEGEAPEKLNGHAVKTAKPKAEQKASKKIRPSRKGGHGRQSKASTQQTAKGN